MSFVSVRTSTIRPGTELLFDVYVFFQETYLVYKKTSESFEPDALDRFKEKKIKKVFIPSEQEPKYLKYLDEALGQLQKADMKVSDRADFAQDALRQESENIGKTLESEEAYRDSEARIHKVVDFMLNEPKALADMLASAGLSIDDSAHGATVSSLCLALGANAGMSKEELTDLAVASLLHDVALSSLGFDAKTEMVQLEGEQKNKFRKHPAVAVEQAAGKKYITPRVLRLIEDHEEFGEGTGFPNKKWYSKLKTDSQIFNLCDALDHFSIRCGVPPVNALEKFISEKGDFYSLELLEILEKKIKA